MRKPFIAGNWKMNKSVAETRDYITAFLPLVKGAEAEIALCVPYTNLYAAAEMLKGTNVILGAQNIAWANKGAFTGEISAPMLLDAGASCVIIGHSERREMFGDTDRTVNMRLDAALKNGLTPILCVGETERERAQYKTKAVIKKQIIAAFENISAADAVKVIVAYEPIWAIGTGRTATPDDAELTCAYIRKRIGAKYSETAGAAIRILYGGSMNPQNAQDLMLRSNIDGGLIGGASLIPEDFVKVVKYNGV